MELPLKRCEGRRDEWCAAMKQNAGVPPHHVLQTSTEPEQRCPLLPENIRREVHQGNRAFPDLGLRKA
jgi:hypothetical protein